MLSDPATGNTTTGAFSTDLVRSPSRSHILATPCSNPDGKPTFTQLVTDQVLSGGTTTKQVSFTVEDDADAAGSLIVDVTSNDPSIVADASLVATHTGAGVYTLDITASGVLGSAVIDIMATDSGLKVAHELFALTVEK